MLCTLRRGLLLLTLPLVELALCFRLALEVHSLRVLLHAADADTWARRGGLKRFRSRSELQGLPAGWVTLGPKDLGFFFQTNKVLRIFTQLKGSQRLLDAFRLTASSREVSTRMEFSIQSVRLHFPEAPFYLLTDGGEPTLF